MKAKLILDEMPKNCGECELHYKNDWEDFICPTNKQIVSEYVDFEKKPDWCPLEPFEIVTFEKIAALINLTQ